MLGRISKPLLFLLFLSGSLLSSCSDLRSFHAIGAAVQTDKVVHGYHELYEFYLGPRRHLPLRLLEVGLGCNMPYGPGASLQLWREYIKNASISYVEYDSKCANKWQKRIENLGRGSLYIGDQSDVSFLNHIVSQEAGRTFDVIIDDGAHEMPHQINTLSVLWQLVSPGGIFVVEDIGTSYMTSYGGGPRGAKNTTISHFKDILDNLQQQYCVDPTDAPCDLLPNLRSMDCWYNACVFVRRTVGSVWREAEPTFQQMKFRGRA